MAQASRTSGSAVASAPDEERIVAPRPGGDVSPDGEASNESGGDERHEPLTALCAESGEEAAFSAGFGRRRARFGGVADHVASRVPRTGCGRTRAGAFPIPFGPKAGRRESTASRHRRRTAPLSRSPRGAFHVSRSPCVGRIFPMRASPPAGRRAGGRRARRYAASRCFMREPYESHERICRLGSSALIAREMVRMPAE